MNNGLDVALEILSRIATGEPGVTATPTGHDPDIDAVIVGLGMLAEELDFERARRAEAEALLEDERDAYARSAGLLCSLDAKSLQILKCNERLAEVVGIAPDALRGKHVLELFRETDWGAAESALRAAASGNGATFPELSLNGASSPITVRTVVSLTRVPSARLRIVWTDVTKERNLEAQLLQAQKMEAVGRLSGAVAHDFNNLLTVILSAGHFLRKESANNAKIVENLALIDEAAKRGAELTSQLLAFARQQVMKPQHVDVGGVVREVHRMLIRLIGEEITLKLVIEDDLVVNIDPSQLSQVLLNLVVNARDALEGSGTILLELRRITLDAAYCEEHLRVAPGRYALVSVSDTGRGMPQDVLAQVFEPFFTTKAPGKGTGLGLSTCYGIAEQAGGHILLYSEPGLGTTAKLYLPLVGHVVRKVDTPTEASTRRPANETILLVEDDALLRSLTTRILEQAGYQVVTASDGEEAVRLATHLASPVDLVVTDLVMPKLGGHGLMDRLRQRDLARTALYVSGYAANQGVLEEGVHFLPKPYTAEGLLRAVQQVLEHKR